MKKSQLWIWQTPVMLSNFAILLFVIGLMISMFDRAIRSQRDWTKGDIQVVDIFSLYLASLPWTHGQKADWLATFRLQSSLAALAFLPDPITCSAGFV